MLTVLGSKGGNDVFWCGFRTSGFPASGIGVQYSSVFGPIPFKLPPNNGRAYYTSEGGFGIAASYMPLGYLESDDSPIKTPKPCQHLDATGTVLIRPENGYPVMGSGSFNNFGGALGYLSLSGSGPRVVQFAGRPTSKGAYYYWKRDGTIARHTDIDFYNTMYLSYPVGNSLPAGSVAYKFGMKYYGTVPPYALAARHTEYRFAPSINGPNSFEIKGSFRDTLTTGDTGSYASCLGSYSISQITGLPDGTFKIYGSYELTTRQWTIDSYGRRVDRPDIVVKQSGWRFLHMISPIPVPVSMKKLTNVFEDELRHYEVLSKDKYSETEMSVARSNAIADITALKSNNLENISGLKGSFSIIGTLVDGYRAVINGDIRSGIKALSSAYLWYSYALAPTVSDLGDISKKAESIKRMIADNPFSNERRRGRNALPYADDVGDIQFNVTYHTRLKDNLYSQLYSALQRVGLHPSVSQGWDFVPFSFVVDWFVGIGPVLSKLDDYNNFVMTRDILHRIESFKTTKTEDYRVSSNPSIYEFIGPYEMSYYQRLVYSGSGDVDPFAGQKSAGVRSSQVMQGASLLVQQLD